MKTKSKLFFWALALSIFFIACDKDNNEVVTAIIDDAVTEEPIDDFIEMGTVSLNTIVKDVIEVTTGKAPTLEEVLDEMTVQIYTFDDPFVVYENYRDLPSNITLPPGSYSLLISKHSYTLWGFDTGNYGDQVVDFDVVAGANTVLDVELKLFDVAATINLSSELALTYPDILIAVSLIAFDPYGNPIGGTLNWAIADDGRTGYFGIYVGDIALGPLYDAGGDLTVEVTASDAFGEPISVTKTYPGVSANQHYNINIEQTEAATASLTVTLGDEEVINDTITFPN